MNTEMTITENTTECRKEKYSQGSILKYKGLKNETIFIGMLCAVSSSEMQLINLNGNRYNEPQSVSQPCAAELSIQEIEDIFRISVISVAKSAEISLTFM